MNYGFIRSAAVTPPIQVADCVYNQEVICSSIDEVYEKGAQIVVFPELCITGYTCSDLFWQDLLLRRAKEALLNIVSHTEGKEILVFVGLPLTYQNKLYNVMAAVNNGKLLGLVPKTHLPNYAEFYEARHFTRGMERVQSVQVGPFQVPFGTNLLFACSQMEELIVGAEICEDVWAPDPPSVRHAMTGATIIVNSSASDEITGKDVYRDQLINGQSARLVCGYIYANAGDGESTTDLVFGGHNLISENGIALAASRRFENQTIYGDIDVYRLVSERRRMTTFTTISADEYEIVSFDIAAKENALERFVDPAPFVPGDKREREKRCEEILSIQAMGLKKRLQHTSCSSAVLGISGGLDSTLALLVTVRAFDLLGIPRSNITAVTMPCFGTTDRTYQNACKLTRQLGADLQEVDIKEAVMIHFRDIGHDENIHDITYENAQARERTQVLMDIANQKNGMVIGTGDMSELALGWATYNGDHMSMYGVNASVPKTLVRYLVDYYASTCEDQELSVTLYDILDTPVSPELLPPKEGEINQKTEDLVGPYELHDFYLYQALRFGFSPAKVYYLAKIAFSGKYDAEIILKWLKVFYRRFFSQQFKRSCLPDGPKVGSVALSPRGDLRMPSDACVRMWMNELENC